MQICGRYRGGWRKCPRTGDVMVIGNMAFAAAEVAEHRDFTLRAKRTRCRLFVRLLPFYG